MSVTFRPGKTAPHPEATHPRLKLRSFLDVTAVTIPETCDWLSAGGSYPMDGNDQYGDCVWACYAHEIQAVTAQARGKAAVLPLSTVLGAYSAVTGFDPRDPSTDQGTNMQDGLSWWRKQGYGGHSIAVFAQVDHRNLDEVLAAIDLFGTASVGFDFPDSAMDQFNAGQPWTVVRGAQVEGGHAVHAGAYDRSGGWIDVITWGKRQRMMLDFWAKYVDEAWVKIPTTDWFNLTGQTPSGLDLPGLGAQFSKLTGEPNPFPAPAPQPIPDPTPAPEQVTPADLTLWAQVHPFLQHPHLLPNNRAARKALLTWGSAKGLHAGGS